MTDLNRWNVARTAEISDALDRLDLGGQVFAGDIRPVIDEPLLTGYARTMQLGYGESQADYEDLLDRMIQFIESLKPGEVPVVSCGLPNLITVTGEILSLAAKLKGAAGWVTDGFARDIVATRELNFALYCAGASPQSFIKRARLVSVDQPVVCGGVTVASQDLIVGDFDGCVAIPQRYADEVYTMMCENLELDRKMKGALLEGESLSAAIAEIH